jgi:Protein of unknown function (DUF732)
MVEQRVEHATHPMRLRSPGMAALRGGSLWSKASGWMIVWFAATSFYSHPAFARSDNLFIAMDPDLLCFMQTSDGRVLDLSRFCGGGKTPVSALSDVDQQFLERYQALLKRRLGASPQVKIALSQSQANPGKLIERARGVCTAMRSGTGAIAASSPPDASDADLISTMAVRYYCPELDN